MSEFDPSKNESGSSKNDIEVVSLEEEMKGSYLDYAMSVIVSRALPDVRDGLKPVHRRILFAMNEVGNDYNKPRRKSARVVGEVMGKYHPHGDAAIYDAMVRLAQDFNMGLPLIDGQGNFGSMDGDEAAAPRYTEARLARAARELLDDIDRDTVDFAPNYDDTQEEPTVLPARFPNLLVNGSNGIAVGMATYIPPHNLGEVIDACCALIDEPTLSIEDLIRIIPGPDFPTGGLIMGRGGILQAYRTGRGSTIVRSKSHVEPLHGGREAIVITEVPFQVNKARMIERIADLVKDKTIPDISNIRDESDREGVRIVIELKKEAVADVVLNQLYRFTPVQTGLSFNMLALVYGRPEQLSLKQILDAFLAFREDVVRRRTRFDLLKARERAHVLVGFATALANIDDMIQLIRQAPDRAMAKQQMLAKEWKNEDVVPLLSLVDDPNNPSQPFYKLSPAQADAILDLRLHRLTGLERQKIHDELTDLSKDIAWYLELLDSRAKVLSVVRQELLEVKAKYATPRRTLIEDAAADCEDEDLIQREDMVVTVSLEGYIKRVPLDTYRSQRRGGRGRAGMTTKEEDIVNDVIVANTHSTLLFFSSLGQVYSLKTYQLPVGSPQSKGRALINLFPLSEGEKISTVLVIPSEEGATAANADEKADKSLIFVTSFGNVRRNKVTDFSRIQSNGKKAMRLENGELLIGVQLASKEDDVLLSTALGMANRFSVESIRVFAGRDSNGVRAIRLAEGDRVISMSILASHAITSEERDAYYRQKDEEISGTASGEPGPEDAENLDISGGSDKAASKDSTEASERPILSEERRAELAEHEQFILTITANGFGKRTSDYAYRTTNRGTKGFANIVVNPRNGHVVASFPVQENDDIVLVTNLGRLMRCPVRDIRITRRQAQGVIIFRVDAEEQVVAVSCVPGSDAAEDEAREGEAQDTPNDRATENTVRDKGNKMG